MRLDGFESEWVALAKVIDVRWVDISHLVDTKALRQV